MEWDKGNITGMVAFINSELDKDRTMKSIEEESFNVNDRVIHKRLYRLGYKREGKKYILAEAKEEKKNEEYNKSITKYNKVEQKKKEAVLILPQMATTSDLMTTSDINSLKELVAIVEPLKAIVEDYHKGITGSITESITNDNKLDVKIATEVKQKLFKVDVEVLEEWEKFIQTHREFKVQDLISQAIREFVNRYK